MRGESEDSNDSYFPQDEEESEEQMQKYRKQAREILSKLNEKEDKGRQILSKNYRKINKMIDRLQKDKFNLTEDPDFLEDVLKCSFFYRPYDLGNPNFKYLSSFCKEAVKGNRRLKTPSIQIEQEIVGINQKSIRLNSNKQEFTLKIESEPYSGILYTNMPNSHPLLMQPNNSYFKKYGEKQILDVLVPPCDINIVAVSDSKIESKVISLKVTSQINEGELRNPNMGYAIRPMETFPFDQSAFGSSQSGSFSNAAQYLHQQKSD